MHDDDEVRFTTVDLEILSQKSLQPLVNGLVQGHAPRDEGLDEVTLATYGPWPQPPPSISRRGAFHVDTGSFEYRRYWSMDVRSPCHWGPWGDATLLTYGAGNFPAGDPDDDPDGRDPDNLIRGYCRALEALPREAMRSWRQAKWRRFDLGIDSGRKGQPVTLRLKTETLARVAALHAEIALTLYPLEFCPPGDLRPDGTEIHPWERSCFIELDLEIRSRELLQPVVDAWGENVFVMHNGPWGDGRHLAAFELSGQRRARGAQGLARRFCKLAESLPPEARALWQRAESRTFDFGLMSGKIGQPLALNLDTETLRRMVKVGGEIVITIYPIKTTPGKKARAARNALKGAKKYRGDADKRGGEAGSDSHGMR